MTICYFASEFSRLLTNTTRLARLEEVIIATPTCALPVQGTSWELLAKIRAAVFSMEWPLYWYVCRHVLLQSYGGRFRMRESWRSPFY